MTDDVRRDDPELNDDDPDQPAGAAAEATTPARPQTTVQRIAENVVWVLGVVAVLFLGRIFLLVDPAAGLSGFERGQLVGRVAGAIFIGFVIRWVWVKLSRRGRVLSPWILVAAALVLGSQLSRDLAAAPPVGSPADAYLEVGAPYVLQTPTADVASRFSDLFARSGSSATVVREIHEDGVAIGYLLVANVGASVGEDFLTGFESGFENNEGAQAHREVVGGTDALVGTGPEFAAVVGKEPPYAVGDYALDEESGKRLAESVMAAYR